MRKSFLRIKYVLTGTLFISSIFLTDASDSLAIPYVKNLHKKCLSKHQDCALECATTHVDEVSETEVSSKAMQCITTCVDQYKECQRILATMRRLNEAKHFEIEDSLLYKPSLPDEEEYD